jgi:predicted PurR-regulated permease PerM
LTLGKWLGLLAVVAALALLWSLRQAVLLIFAGVVVAMALCTLVGAVQKRLGCSRPLAVLLSLLGVLVIVVVAGTTLIPPFVHQFGELITKLPAAAAELVKLMHGGLEGTSRMVYGNSGEELTWLKSALPRSAERQEALGASLSAALIRLLGLAGNIGNGLLQCLFVLAVALMITSQPIAYREVALQLVPSFYRPRARTVLLQCGEALSAWMVGVLISSLCVGTMAAIGLSLLGVKQVAANAVLAGLLNIIPNVGPTLSTLFPISAALLEAPWKAVLVLILYIIIQNLESYLITPSVMHHQLKLLPGLTLSAQLLFTLMFGPLGLVLALPLAVCMQVILREVLIRDILDPWTPPRRPPALP